MGFFADKMNNLNARVSAAKDAQIEAGEVPFQQPVIKRLTGATYDAVVWFDRAENVWKLKRTDKTTKAVWEAEAPTYNDIAEMLLVARGEESAANQEIESYNRKVELGLPADLEYESWEELDANYESAAARLEFLNNYREGQEYASVQQWANEEEQQYLYHALKGFLGSQHLPVTAANLMFAYNHSLDNNEKFRNIVDTILEARKAAEQADAIIAARKEAEASIEPAPVIANPSGNVTRQNVSPIKHFGLDTPLTPRQVVRMQRGK